MTTGAPEPTRRDARPSARRSGGGAAPAPVPTDTAPTSSREEGISRPSNRDRFDALVSLLPEWVWATDAAGALVQASARSVDLFGRHPAELLGRPVTDVIQPLDWTISAASMGRSRRTGPASAKTSLTPGLCALIRRDGSRRLAWAEARSLYDRSHGRFVGLQGVARCQSIGPDILRGLTDLFAMLEGSMGLAVLIGPEDTPCYANDRLLEVTGFGRNELRSMRMDDLVEKTAISTAPATDSRNTGAAAGMAMIDDAVTEPNTHGLPAPFSPLRLRTRRGERLDVSAWLGPWYTDGGSGEARRLLLTFDATAIRAFDLLPAMNRLDRQPSGPELIGDFCRRVTDALSLLGPEAPPGFDPTKGDGDTQSGLDGRRRDRAQGAITRLPRRQREVLNLLAEGRSNKAIARMLGISEATVKTHVRVLCEKLGADNRTQAATLAAQLNR